MQLKKSYIVHGVTGTLVLVALLWFICSWLFGSSTTTLSPANDQITGAAADSGNQPAAQGAAATQPVANPNANGQPIQPAQQGGNVPQPAQQGGNVPQPAQQGGNVPQPPQQGGNVPEPPQQQGGAPQPQQGGAPQPQQQGGAVQPTQPAQPAQPAQPTAQPTKKSKRAHQDSEDTSEETSRSSEGSSDVSYYKPSHHKHSEELKQKRPSSYAITDLLERKGATADSAKETLLTRIYGIPRQIQRHKKNMPNCHLLSKMHLFNLSPSISNSLFLNMQTTYFTTLARFFLEMRDSGKLRVVMLNAPIIYTKKFVDPNEHCALFIDKLFNLPDDLSKNILYNSDEWQKTVDLVAPAQDSSNPNNNNGDVRKLNIIMAHLKYIALSIAINVCGMLCDDTEDIDYFPVVSNKDKEIANCFEAMSVPTKEMLKGFNYKFEVKTITLLARTMKALITISTVLTTEYDKDPKQQLNAILQGLKTLTPLFNGLPRLLSHTLSSVFSCSIFVVTRAKDTYISELISTHPEGAYFPDVYTFYYSEVQESREVLIAGPLSKKRPGLDAI